MVPCCQSLLKRQRSGDTLFGRTPGLAMGCICRILCRIVDHGFSQHNHVFVISVAPGLLYRLSSLLGPRHSLYMHFMLMHYNL